MVLVVQLQVVVAISMEVVDLDLEEVLLDMDQVVVDPMTQAVVLHTVLQDLGTLLAFGLVLEVDPCLAT